MMLSSDSTGKYIPPRRRQQLADTASGSTERQAEPVLFSANAQRSFTTHALIRREQRDISHQSINEAVKTGISLEHSGSTTHIDETTQVVTARNGKVITVVDNKRNSNFDAMRFSREKEQVLIRKAERHNDSAMCELAELYLSGELGTREVQKAYHWLLRAANDKKNSHAMCLLSNIHGSGDLGPPDPEGALLWLEKAAERHNRYALAVLGQRCLSTYLKMKERGDIEESKKMEMQRKIMSYLHQSANRGSTRAMWQLGQIAEEGWFGEKDVVTAVEIYTKAGKLGSPASLDSLNELVSAGVVTEQEFEGILAIASELVGRTSSELAVELGLKQIEGLLGKNPERGIKMIEQAAQQRNVKAIKVLAKCYEDGKGCTVNLSTSRYWFQKLGELYGDAGRNGNVDALFDLGRLFLSGKLGEIDLEKARQQLVKASEADNPEFSYYLGRLYIEGCLGNYSPSEGTVWINKAIVLWTEQASEGNIEAIYELVNIYLNKDLGFKDYAKAISWLTILAKEQKPLAMLMLSNIYLKAKPQYRNVSQAIEWLYLASSMEGEQNSIKESTMKLEFLLHRKDWSVAEGEQIVQTMLKLAGEAEEEGPYRIGRILGDIFSKGNLLPSDFKKAFFWYEKSAGFENSTAMFRLGELCEAGALGTDLSKAVEWYNLSAKMGNKKATIQLCLLKDSEGLSEHDKLIIQPWFDKCEKLIKKSEIEPAISKDDENSVKQKERLEALYQMGLEEKAKNPQLAVCKLKKVVKEGACPAANFELGEIYSSGVLGEKVLPVAMLFYKRAARQKHPVAVEKLVNHYTDGKLVVPDLSKSEKWKSRLVKK